MTKPVRDVKLRWLGHFLAALTVVLVTQLGTGNPSAAATQIRVGAQTSDAKVVAPHCSIGGDRRVGSGQSTYDSVLAALPVAEDPVAAVSRDALGYGYGAATIYDASVWCVDARTVARVEAVGRQATVVPLRSQVDAASAGSVVVSGFGVAAEALPALEIDAARMPNIARNVQSALDEGHPGVLNRTMDTDLMKLNRAGACRGFCGPGSPDEYPFASTLQGGAGARVAGVPLNEQFIQGAVIRNFYAKFGIGDGDPFRVFVTGLEP